MDYRLKLPVTDKDILKIKTGDVVYLSGRVVTARDEAHKEALEHFDRGHELPVDF